MIIANKLKDLDNLKGGHQIERSKSQMLSFRESQDDVERQGMPRIRASQVEIFNNSYANTRDLFTEADTPEQQWTQSKQIAVPTIDELVKLELRPNRQEYDPIPKFVKKNRGLQKNPTEIDLRAGQGGFTIPTKVKSKRDEIRELNLQSS